MSLTSLLQHSDVRKRFAAEFPKPRVSLQGQIRALPANPSDAGLVGTALDYLLRVHVYVQNTNVKERQWVAESAINMLRACISAGRPIFVGGQRRTNRAVVRRAEGIVKEARHEYERCKRRKCVTAKMLQCTVLL